MLNRIHGGNVWVHLKETNSLKNTLIDFSANINPLGLPSKTKKVMMKNFSFLANYPDPGYKHLKKSLAIFHNINPGNLLVGNGSTEIIHLIPKVFKSKNVLIPIPSFSEYEFAARTNCAKPIFVNSTKQNDFQIDIFKLNKFIPRADLVFLCNPNNPTGALLYREQVLLLLNSCIKHKTILVIDEVFMDFVQISNEITLIPEAVRNKFLLILKSLTKSFAIPGLRLGYLIGHRDLISKMSEFQYPWNVNSLAQVIGEEVIKDRDYLKKSREFILKEKSYLYERLKNIKGLRPYPPSSNFVFCKLENSKYKSIKRLSRNLIKKGIMIRNCDNFRGLNGRFFRVAVRKRAENIKLISALEDALR